MRWYFISFLILLNILYLAWELNNYTQAQKRTASAAILHPDVNRLGLLSELEDSPTMREQLSEDENNLSQNITTGSDTGNDYDEEEQLVENLPEIQIPQDASSSSPGACFSFGPIPDEAQARGLINWFKVRNTKSFLRHDDGDSRKLLWIYLAPQESVQSAMAILQDLKSKGITDYKLISRGSLQNAISLGLYSSQAAINKRIKELEREGYKPVVVPYSNIKRIYWIDVRLQKDSATIEQMLGGFPSRYNSIPVKCDSIAMS